MAPDAGRAALNLVGFGGALLLCRYIARRASTWMTYAHFFSIPWAANIIIAQIALGGALRPETATLLVLFGAWWLFLGAAGAFITPTGPPSRDILSVSRRRANAALWLLVILQALAFATEVGTIGQSPVSYFLDFRNNAIILRTADPTTLGPTWFSFSLWRWDHVLYLPLALFLNSGAALSTARLVLVFSWAAVMASAKFTRAPLLSAIVVSIVAWVSFHNPSPRLRRRVLCFGGLMLVLAFMAVQTTLEAHNPWVDMSLGDSVVAYIGASPAAYQEILKGKYFERLPGLYSAEPFNYLLFKFHVIESYPGVSRPEAASLPIHANLYTFLDAFTLDGGLPGVALGVLSISGLMAWSYNRAHRRASYGPVTVYGYLTYCCVMAFANNEFIRINVFLVMALAFSIDFAITRRAVTFPGSSLNV
jgi:oligosaccharide repeat unit polymerase